MRFISALILLLTADGLSAQPRLVTWSEHAGELGLGYPVPMPVDTPLPFDGFRSYAGLHSRHQDLQLTTSWVHGSVVGQTFQNREVWAYRLGDQDLLTATGLPEPAMMTQGGIHAREWQSPEVLTAIMEKWVEDADDDPIVGYLLENANIVVLPVLNIDGFMQTQRYPRQNYLDSDPNNPLFSPRDGRMRRKNMRLVDNEIFTVNDHLIGVDLNRNNPPFWASGNANTPDSRALTHHGPGPHSEGETQAMVAAAELGPAQRLRMYTDVHSFQQVFFSVHTGNNRRNAIQDELLRDFSTFHATLVGNKVYRDRPSTVVSNGIGSTDEYFALTYQIPSWTLEIEPTGNGGVDYGGFGSNGHDGFILPEAEIRRVRENLAEAFAIAYYRQSGPPAISAVRWIDNATGAVVFDAEWDIDANGQRSLHSEVIQGLNLDQSYTLWIAYDKPMRWRDNGQVAALPGQAQSTLDQSIEIEIDGQALTAVITEQGWLDQAGAAPEGYYRYRDDAYAITLSFPRADNADLPSDTVEANLNISTRDLLGQHIDADPSTAVDWADGHWVGYENSAGVAGDSGGNDRGIRFPIQADTDLTTSTMALSPGHSAAWFDLSHDGEGFLVEIVGPQRAVIYWFTYDEGGKQRWFIGEGRLRGNEIVIDQLNLTRGGIFGPAFDPDEVVIEPAGAASFIWRDCDHGSMRHNVSVRNQRQQLNRLSQPMDLTCGAQAEDLIDARISGTWYNAALSGQGFVIQQLSQDRAIVYWFTYDDQGQQAWIFGDGRVLAPGQIIVDDALISQGGIFGDDFNPDSVVFSSWGRIEFNLDCDSGMVSYDSHLPAYGQGEQSLQRLTRLHGTRCPIQPK